MSLIPKPWSKHYAALDAEALAIFKADPSLSVQKIADRLGVNYQVVRKSLHRSGVVLRTGGNRGILRGCVRQKQEQQLAAICRADAQFKELLNWVKGRE